MTNIFSLQSGHQVRWEGHTLGSQAALDENQLWQLSHLDRQSQQVLNFTFLSPNFLMGKDMNINVTERNTGE